MGEDLTTGVWNNFTLIHNGNTLDFILNGRGHRMLVHGTRYYLRFDPHIFVGGDRKPLGLGKYLFFPNIFRIDVLLQIECMQVKLN